jgi:hypothetical protein
MAKRTPTSVPTNPDSWSERSKRSFIFDDAPTEYSDIHYLCWRCQKPTTFSAEAQRQAYEVLKAYIWQRPNLCEDCWRRRTALEKNIRECRREWNENRATLRPDEQFLHQWLSSLEDVIQLGGKRDEANIAMLRRVLGTSP